MQKRPGALAWILLSVLIATAAAYADAGEVPAVDHRFCLTYLLAPSEEPINREIYRLGILLEEPRTLGAGETAALRYAAGVLHTYLYIRSQRKNDAFRAKELLESAETEFTGRDLFTVHLGMAHAFVASIRTVFGTGDLKKMQKELQSVDREHPDWLIRFLRGITLVEVGRALPGIFSIREIKTQAVETGSRDLRYVLSRSRMPATEVFDPGTYDFAAMPVPGEVARKAEIVLAAE